MRQFQFAYSTVEDAVSGVGEIRAALDSVPHRDAAAFVFLIACDREDAGRLLAAWDSALPEVKRVGITEGFEVGTTQQMQIVFNLITAEDEAFHAIQIPCAPGGEEAAAGRFARFAEGIPDLKGAALYPTNPMLNITRFLKNGCQHVPVFGAEAAPLVKVDGHKLNYHMEPGFCVGEKLLDSGFSALLIAGKRIHINLEYILGWSPIGREMEPELGEDDSVGETKIRLIDGRPALEIYRKYLGVEWDRFFIRNVCEFPLMVRRDGVDICMIPMDSRNGGLTLTGTVEPHEKLRFSYSTRETVLKAAREGSERMKAFDAEVVIMSICGNRTNCLQEEAHLEWDYFREKNPELAFNHGYCEIAYESGKGGVLNSAIVAVGFRESDGSVGELDGSTFITAREEMDSHVGPIPLSYRVSHFFHIMTEELVHFQRHLEDEVERKTRENERLSLHVVQTLAEAIDAKDTYTNGHSSRVAKYAREIAGRAGYSQEGQDRIYMLGLLHDVGKIGVPDAVINKPGRLNDEEFGLIKNHPIMGARILQTIEEMPELVTGARFHHERYDGRGYPDGLAAEAIPEEARIIGVADAYDAMTSNRSYRSSMNQQAVREQIRQGMGTQFDPRFAEIMLKMMDEDTDYQMREH